MKKSASGGLNDLLQQALVLVEHLHRALREEHSALSSNNLPEFEASIQKKIAHTTALETLEQTIFSLLRNAGFSWDRNGLTQYVNTLDSPEERRSILNYWEKLRDAIVQCQTQNQINGRILNIASLNIRQALEVLTGQKLGNTYRADGKSNNGGGNDKIAIA